MAESACLRRSFSNPTETSHDFSQGNPMHALGDSISFGRYMSESLAWEKWSTFSHNRYLEEAEKSSKPGSVAKMKAYFEAHYRKKQAALEQVNDGISYVEPEVVETHNLELVSSSSSSLSSSSSSSSVVLNPETVFPDCHSNVKDLRRSLSSPILHLDTALLNSNPKIDTPTGEPLVNFIVSSCDSSSQIKEPEKEEANIVKSSINTGCKDCSPEVQVYQCVDTEVNASIRDNSSKTKVIPSKDALGIAANPVTPKKYATIEKEAKKEKLDSRSKQKPADLSSKSSKKSNVSKLSSSLARLATPVRPKMEVSGTPKLHQKFARESVEKKEPTSKLVQASIDVNSDAKLMKKSSPSSHKTGIGKAFTPLGKIIRQSFAHSPAPSTSRASVSSVSRHTSATPQSETRRSRIALEKSFSRNKTDQKMQSPSVGNVKSSAQSPITFSPFSFRTEERAVKRREFFERRLEKEAENMQLLEKAKAKTKADIRKSSPSVNFTNTTVDIRREVLSDKTKKIPVPRPQLPKCEGKPSTNLTRGKFSQPPPRSGVASKSAAGNLKSISVTLPSKKRQENASPNII